MRSVDMSRRPIQDLQLRLMFPQKRLNQRNNLAIDALQSANRVLIGAYLASGKALNTAEILNGVHTIREAKDAYALSSRLRFAF